jgi:hypothetical protein
MASGNDMRIGLSKETVYGTRVTPSRFIAINGESIDYSFNRYFSPALGVGRWARPSVLTSSSGGGDINGDVPTTGFGFLLDALHGNTVTPAQQGGTTAYLQTHTLDTPPAKSYSVQVQTPPVATSTLLPVDLYGVVFGGLSLSWSAAGVLKWSMPTIARELNTAQTLATYVAPTSWSVFGFQGGALTIAGSPIADIVGDGSLNVGFNLRDDAFALGTAGLMSKPVETDKPTASGTFTADFNDLTHLNRVTGNTIADIVLTFTGATIVGTYKYFFEITLKDCVFTSPRPTVDGPGPVQQTVTFTSAPSVSTNVPVIRYQSTDVTI